MSVECKASNIDGHGFVFLVDKHIFIASVHIAGNPISSVKEIMGLNMNDHPSAMHADCMSVRQCLERTIPYAPN